MAVNPNEDTEFNDALRQHGIIPPKPTKPPTPSPPSSPSLTTKLQSATVEELDLLDENTADSDEERAIESYRRQRIAEMKKESMRSRRFGSIIPIGRAEYTREVTEASEVPEPDEDEKDKTEDALKGTPVICLLYQEGNEPASVRLTSQLRIIAAKYPRIKVASIVGNKCIENYPDRHLPSLFLYRNGSLRRQFIAYGKDRERSVEELEVLLMATSMIDPRGVQSADILGMQSTNARDRHDSESEGDAREPRSTIRVNESGSNTNFRSKTIRSGAMVSREEDDSDFDL